MCAAGLTEGNDSVATWDGRRPVERAVLHTPPPRDKEVLLHRPAPRDGGGPHTPPPRDRGSFRLAYMPEGDGEKGRGGERERER